MAEPAPAPAGAAHSEGARRPAGLEALSAAAAGATAIVSLTAHAHPVGSDGWRVWADAVANEWLVCFTLLYLAVSGGLVLAARFEQLGGTRLWRRNRW